mmetsp:Transcript_116868/g.268169  ORF Transcript_116868/g.268169 Transcript_116868/m.268169 type:complete len:272 (-) Transcript_116868:399-1214(-)
MLRSLAWPPSVAVRRGTGDSVVVGRLPDCPRCRQVAPVASRCRPSLEALVEATLKLRPGHRPSDRPVRVRVTNPLDMWRCMMGLGKPCRRESQSLTWAWMKRTARTSVISCRARIPRNNACTRDTTRRKYRVLSRRACSARSWANVRPAFAGRTPEGTGVRVWAILASRRRSGSYRNRPRKDSSKNQKKALTGTYAAMASWYGTSFMGPVSVSTIFLVCVDSTRVSTPIPPPLLLDTVRLNIPMPSKLVLMDGAKTAGFRISSNAWESFGQ